MSVETAPVIETDRLILREFRREDFDSFAAMLGNGAVTEYLGGTIEDRAQSWEKFLRGPGFWALLGYGLWTVEEKETGRIAGNVGFGAFERAIDPPLPDVPEAAWVLDAWAHGKGYGGEAVGAALDWADDQLDFDSQVCIISPGNAPSIGLAQKFGFQQVREAPFKGDPILIFERAVLR